jgi:hypothetical protein
MLSKDSPTYPEIFRRLHRTLDAPRERTTREASLIHGVSPERLSFDAVLALEITASSSSVPIWPDSLTGGWTYNGFRLMILLRAGLGEARSGFGDGIRRPAGPPASDHESPASS